VAGVRWDDVRYRGDALDVEELTRTYRLNDYLNTFEENRRQAEVFCLPAAAVNAFATIDIREARAYSLIGVTSSALERLEDLELRFILGHELGHILFGNNRLDGLRVEAPCLADAELEDAVDEMIHLTRRYPYRPVDRAMMQVVALGGALLLGADSEINDDEVKILIQILHRFFTDEPDAEIVTDPAEAAARLPQAIAVLNAEGDATAKNFVLSRLTDIALADGALMDAESAVILDLAHQLGLPNRAAYSLVVGAAQTMGFRNDVKLNKMSEEIRRGLQAGFRRADGLRPSERHEPGADVAPLGLVW
jgi:uncharacterized tellurite resistance protein B-like protein